MGPDPSRKRGLNPPLKQIISAKGGKRVTKRSRKLNRCDFKQEDSSRPKEIWAEKRKLTCERDSRRRWRRQANRTAGPGRPNWCVACLTRWDSRGQAVSAPGTRRTGRTSRRQRSTWPSRASSEPAASSSHWRRRRFHRRQPLTSPVASRPGRKTRSLPPSPSFRWWSRTRWTYRRPPSRKAPSPWPKLSLPLPTPPRFLQVITHLPDGFILRFICWVPNSAT